MARERRKIGPPEDRLGSHDFRPPPPGQGGGLTCSRCGIRKSVAIAHADAGAPVVCTQGALVFPNAATDRRSMTREERVAMTRNVTRLEDADPMEDF